jgi:hypothetical protein
MCVENPSVATWSGESTALMYDVPNETVLVLRRARDLEQVTRQLAEVKADEDYYRRIPGSPITLLKHECR